MKNKKEAKVVENILRYNELPDDIKTLKKMIVDVLNQNQTIIEKLNKFMG